MHNIYLAIHLDFEKQEPEWVKEWLTGILGELGCNSFEERENRLSGYILKKDFNRETMEDTLQNAGLLEKIKLETEVIQTDITGVHETFDVIIANINCNIILHDLPYYAKCCKPGGQLITSGFYRDDLPVVKEKAMEHGFLFEEMNEKNNWIMVKFLKKKLNF